MREISPPRLAQKLFDWFCSDAAVEDLRGDMDELFFVNLKRMSAGRAKAKYWIHTISLITSYAVKKRKHSTRSYSSFSNSIDMLRSYFIIATRSLAKHKFFTIINVLGLAIGMSLSLLFIAMLSYIATYDNFHVNHERIFRVITKTNIRDNSEFATTPAPLAEKLQQEYPGIEKVIRISILSAEAEKGNSKIPMSGLFVNPGFLSAFTFPLAKGNATSALAKPNNLLITEKGAERMFGAEDPVGKVITLDPYGEFEITGIMKNPPKNSHIQFEILVSHTALDVFKQQNNVASINQWTELERNYTYLLFPEAVMEGGEAQHNLQEYLNRVAKEVYEKKDQPGGQPEFKATFDLQPLSNIAGGDDLSMAIGPVWDITGMSIFGVLTLLILLPACFNYTNISISRALKRSKEIGLRKVVGGQRNQIFSQFILETVIVTLLALVVSYFLFNVARGEFTSMMVASEFLDLTPTAATWLYFVAFAVLVGLLAGAVPALYFSKLNPVQALKSKSASKASTGSVLRKGLVVVQFALSLGFIMGVAITAKQHIATLNYNFGFTQENILDVNLQGVDPDIFRNEFSKLSSVQSVSMSSNVMGASMPSMTWIQKPDGKDSLEVPQMFVDENYIANLDLKLAAGKSFADQSDGREHFVIVNEEFLKYLKITNPPDALDKTFVVAGGDELRILGVAKNFHYLDLREAIKPFFFRYNPDQFEYANLKIVADDMKVTMAGLDAAWRTIGGEKKFEARFFDDEIEEAYSVYTSMVKICGFLGLLAITISCLGLLGMVVYTAETRTKEIGVRKVMGASATTIAILLSKDYVKLMLIAAVIATPITYFFFDAVFFGNQYYRIPIGGLEIVASLLFMLVLGTGTILSQTLKASKANPVDTLRCE